MTPEAPCWWGHQGRVLWEGPEAAVCGSGAEGAHPLVLLSPSASPTLPTPAPHNHTTFSKGSVDSGLAALLQLLSAWDILARQPTTWTDMYQDIKTSPTLQSLTPTLPPSCWLNLSLLDLCFRG